MWYSPNETITKNRLFNFEVGVRGVGKTTGAFRYGVEQFLKRPPFEIAYIRRYKEETRKSKEDWAGTLVSNSFFPGVKFGLKGNTGLVNDKPFVHFKTLSVDGRIKGPALPNLRLIIFDEFLVDTKVSRYLPDDVNTFLSLYDTLARPNDPARARVPVLFLANAMSFTNPYFTFWGVVFNEKGEFKTKSIFARMYSDAEFVAQAQHSEFAQLIKGTQYAEHSIGNSFLLDNRDFIEPRANTAKPMCTLKYKGKFYGVWIDWDLGKVWLSFKYDPSNKLVYTFSKEDMTPNTLTAKFFKSTYYCKVIMQAFNTGCLYYEHINIKNNWYQIARLIG